LSEVLVHEEDDEIKRLREEFKLIMDVNNPVNHFTSRVFVNVNCLLTVVTNHTFLFATDVLEDLSEVLRNALFAFRY
jgi:hypothetical protein